MIPLKKNRPNLADIQNDVVRFLLDNCLLFLLKNSFVDVLL